jgi:uncharacterized membrane protein HdeD (DUF308 family)
MSTSKFSKLTKPFILLGIGLILLGGLSIYAPQQSGLTVGILVGIFLVFSGLFRTVFFWIATSWGSAILRLLMGLLAVVAGIVMIADPVLGLHAVTIVAIAYLIIDGVTQILFALRLPPGAGGIWILLGGALSVVLGVLIWREWPFSGDQAIGILIGVKLIMDGIVLIALASVARAAGAAISKL